jgi:glutaredoxin-like protein NrdH
VTITVYSKPGCQQCTATYRALDRAALQYQVVDVVETPTARAYIGDELGYSSLPVVVIDDHDHWAGYRPDSIARAAAAQRSQAGELRTRVQE